MTIVNDLLWGGFVYTSCRGSEAVIARAGRLSVVVLY